MCCQRKPPAYRVEIPTAGSFFMMPKPSGERLVADVEAIGALGVQRIVSLLTVDEIVDAKLQGESAVCGAANIDFDELPIRDRGVPDKGPFSELVKSVAMDLSGGRNVAVHCYAGIGRSGLLACCVLQELGFSVGDAVEIVSHGRGETVPETEEQLAFVCGYGVG